MSFSIDDYALPPLRCYSDAKAYWEKTKPWRGDADTNTRPLAGRKRSQTIRRLNDGSFACRLHGTDVVTYHPNGDVTLQPYPSVSTDAFARRLTPNGVSTSFNDAAGYVVILSDEIGKGVRFYRISAPHSVVKLTLRRNDQNIWVPVDLNETMPFIKYKLDTKKKNRAFKEHDVAGFKAWLNARMRLGGNYVGYYWLYNADHHDILDRLRNTESWEGLYKEYGRYCVDAVRNAVYLVEKCIVSERLPYVESWNAIKAVTASSRKYSQLSKGN